MTIFHSIILGAVEGITEFLPISSTGHLILFSKLLNLSSTDFLKSFEIFIQLGAIMAVIAIYARSFLNFKNLQKLVVGSIPTAFIGFGFYKVIKNNLLGSESIVLWAMLLGGIILILFEYFYRGPDVPEESTTEITYKESFFIGIFQSLAIIPGVSRSAATILGGLALGIPRQTIVKFSFMLAVPAMIGATGLDIYHNPIIFSADNLLILLAGFLSAFIVAIIAIKFLLRFIKKNNFTPFGVYRIIAAVAFYFLIF